MGNKCAYGLVTRMIAQALQEDASLTIWQLHIITGARRDAIYKAVQRNGQVLRRSESLQRGGRRLVVSCCHSADLMNAWLLQGIVRDGSKANQSE